MSSFELFVATRYLRAQRKQVMISVITVISIIGVAAGVMALVIALAINNGFRSSLEGSLLGATAHVSILEKETAVGIDNWQQIAEKLSKIPHVTSASPGLYDPSYIVGPVSGSGAVIKGVSVKRNAAVPDTLRYLKAGSLGGLVSAEGELPGVILGSRLADSIGAVVGKTCPTFGAQRGVDSIRPAPEFCAAQSGGNLRIRLLRYRHELGFYGSASGPKSFRAGRRGEQH